MMQWSLRRSYEVGLGNWCDFLVDANMEQDVSTLIHEKPKPVEVIYTMILHVMKL